MYKNKEAIATAGKTNPTKGTKIDGRKEAAMIYIYMYLFYFVLD